MTNRVQGLSRIDLDDICCPICHNLLWKLVACQSCETHFCLAYINQWLETNPRKCPMRCDRYIERPRSRSIIKQLAKLKIDCIHQPNGCEEVSQLIIIVVLFFVGCPLWSTWEAWRRVYPSDWTMFGLSVMDVQKRFGWTQSSMCVDRMDMPSL